MVFCLIHLCYPRLILRDKWRKMLKNNKQRTLIIKSISRHNTWSHPPVSHPCAVPYKAYLALLQMGRLPNERWQLLRCSVGSGFPGPGSHSLLLIDEYFLPLATLLSRFTPRLLTTSFVFLSLTLTLSADFQRSPTPPLSSACGSQTTSPTCLCPSSLSQYTHSSHPAHPLHCLLPLQLVTMETLGPHRDKLVHAHVQGSV